MTSVEDVTRCGRGAKGCGGCSRVGVGLQGSESEQIAVHRGTFGSASKYNEKGGLNFHLASMQDRLCSCVAEREEFRQDITIESKWSRV